MPNYIKKKLQEYIHVFPNRPQYCPYLPKPKRFGSEAQAPLPPNTLPPLDAEGIKRAQQIVGSILYYAWAVNMMVVIALSSITVKQTMAKTRPMGRCIKLLDNLATNSHAQAFFHASDTIINIHSDASCIRTFFYGLDAKHGKPMKLNGAFYVNTTML